MLWCNKWKLKPSSHIFFSLHLYLYWRHNVKFMSFNIYIINLCTFEKEERKINWLQATKQMEIALMTRHQPHKQWHDKQTQVIRWRKMTRESSISLFVVRGFLWLSIRLRSSWRFIVLCSHNISSKFSVIIFIQIIFVLSRTLTSSLIAN